MSLKKTCARSARARTRGQNPLVMVYSTKLCELLPLKPSLWLAPPRPCVNKYTVYTFTVCKGGRGLWGSGSQTDKHLPQSPFTGQFFKHFALASIYLISPWLVPTSDKIISKKSGISHHIFILVPESIY
jgi:hypothetical protein